VHTRTDAGARNRPFTSEALMFRLLSRAIAKTAAIATILAIALPPR